MGHRPAEKSPTAAPGCRRTASTSGGDSVLQSEAGPHAVSGLDSHQGLEATAHSPTDTVTIPDSDLLFSGDYKRAGNDLILTDAKQKFVVRDYFLHDKHPTLLSPSGAAITPDVVHALAGPLAPGQYAQARRAAGAGAGDRPRGHGDGQRRRDPQRREHHAAHRRRPAQGRRAADRRATASLPSPSTTARPSISAPMRASC